MPSSSTDSCSSELSELLREHCVEHHHLVETLQSEGRLALLTRLKAEGVASLAARQEIANCVGRLLRELQRPPQMLPEIEALRLGSPLVVRAVGGMCNRLRVVLTWRRVAEQKRQPLVVEWLQSSGCPGDFDEFWTLPNEPPVHIVRDAASLLAHPGLQMDDSCRPHPAIGEDDTPASAACYAALSPRSDLLEEAAAIAGRLGRFVALHVRRTDHKYGAKEDDDEYEAFVEQFGGAGVFLATDNVETQNHFAQRLGGRMSVLRPIPAVQEQAISDEAATRGLSQTRRWEGDGVRARDYRHTPLRDGMLDLLVCAHAEAFKGSRFSSFSDTILQLRRLRRCRDTSTRLDEHVIKLPNWGDSYDNSWEADLVDW